MDKQFESSIKTQITNIIKIEYFQTIIKKLTINEKLDDKEKEYILSCALIFLEYYKNDKRYTTYFEFAYYIILKYSIIYNDYLPLYDIATNLWFYPISKFILNKDLINDNILDFFIDIKLNNFFNWEYTETLEQKNIRNDFLKDDSNELTYTAPTSYWKSSLITEYLLNLEKNKDYKIWIIVPTKSLLVQTYKQIKKSWINKKILIHDEMYSNENSFIWIFTQERALRLLKKNPWIYFDILFIDEAHNIFDKDSRSILLSRLISKNLKLNSNCKNIYLSPFISDPNNLKIIDNQTIKWFKINFNIKELELYEYNLDNQIIKHNRFMVWWWDEYKWFLLWKGKSPFEYIINSSLNKNFIYHKRPKIIQQISLELLDKIKEKWIKIIHSQEIDELVEILEKQTHKDFYWIDLIRNWIVYIHWKMPDIIKEYLEEKFKKIADLKYIIANKVILEWVNLPIDNLFILHTHWLWWKELINLVGRVNRLNNVFDDSNENLSKLLSNIHFIHTDYEDTRIKKQLNTIKDLRNKLFEDNIKNPILKEYEIEKNLTWKPEEKEKQKEKILAIQENEKLLWTEFLDEKNILKQYLIENWINDFYNYSFLDKVVEFILDKSKQLPSDWNEKRLLDKIYEVFIKDIWKHNWTEFKSYLSDYEIERLKNISARNYYEYFIEINLKKNLNDNILWIFNYFKEKSTSEIETERKFYFWESYWEVIYNSEKYNQWNKEVYVDVRTKTDKELINLAIVKIKLEENFIWFKLNKLIVFLYDYKLITSEEYNLYVYWTNDEKVIWFINRWLTPSLTKRLETDNQLNNINIDNYWNLVWNNDFIIYKTSVNDFYKFELEKYIF